MGEMQKLRKSEQNAKQEEQRVFFKGVEALI